MTMWQFHIGTYAGNGGAGLYPLRRSSAGGWAIGDAYGGACNVSFGTYAPRHGLHYLVDEQTDGALGVFRETEDGWQGLVCVSTGGADPCHLALDASQNHLAVANYGTGSIALFGLDPGSGLPLMPPMIRGHIGSGPVRQRQEGPHAHCVRFSPDQNWLYHVDLGTDEILSYAFDAAAGSLGAPAVAFRAPAGSGPRHLVFHPTLSLALLASELASTLTVLRVGKDGSLAAGQVVSTLPPGFAGENLVGLLSLNEAGERVYVTNRGHDSIAVFAWEADGLLRPLQLLSSGGASPRSLLLVEAERQLIVANEKAGAIVIIEVGADGLLSRPVAEIPVPGAAFAFSARE